MIRTRFHRQNGFTLIELMIVIAIMAILASVAIPSLIASRMSSNEAAAISTMRVIHTVNEQYRGRFGSYSANLADLQSADYIDNVLGAGSKSGYSFTLAGLPFTWDCHAEPVTPGRTGVRGFFCDASGVIRFVTSGTADALSPAVQ